MGWELIVDIINKFLPGRKAAAVQKIQDLTKQYALALKENRDTDAAFYLKQIKALREKFGVTEGDV